MRKRKELEIKAQELNRAIIDLEFIGCARTEAQDRQLDQLSGAYDALLYALGCTKNCRAIR